jgi:hypothetical protein
LSRTSLSSESVEDKIAKIMAQMVLDSWTKFETEYTAN